MCGEYLHESYFLPIFFIVTFFYLAAVKTLINIFKISRLYPISRVDYLFGLSNKSDGNLGRVDSSDKFRLFNQSFVAGIFHITENS